MTYNIFHVCTHALAAYQLHLALFCLVHGNTAAVQLCNVRSTANFVVSCRQATVTAGMQRCRVATYVCVYRPYTTACCSRSHCKSSSSPSLPPPYAPMCWLPSSCSSCQLLFLPSPLASHHHLTFAYCSASGPYPDTAHDASTITKASDPAHSIT